MIKEKIVQYDELKDKLKACRECGKKIVLTNGCFDLIHSGHVKMLEMCKTYGDILIVAINSDSSIKLNKGENRPILPLDERETIISALNSVDYVYPFDEKTPFRYIKELKPDVYIKGGDYNMDNLVGENIGYNEIRDYCGDIKLIDICGDISTTDIIDKIMNIYKVGD